VRRAPPLVVLVLGGVAERWECPADASPLSLAATPHLDRLAADGRVFGVSLIEEAPESAAPLLALLGFDPHGVETAAASYLAVLHGAEPAPGECFARGNFISLFRDLVADPEPHLRPAESDLLLQSVGTAIERAGFRLVPGPGPAQLVIAQRGAVDATLPAATAMIGKEVSGHEPRREGHAFAHRRAREALDGHEVNEVRRDLGGNGADMLWICEPGGTARLDAAWDVPVSALGTDPVWRGVCQAAGVPVRAPSARTAAQLLRGVGNALKRDAVCFVHTRKGERDAFQRQLGARTEGLATLDGEFVGPLADLVAGAGGRLLVIADVPRSTADGVAFAEPVPALLWGAGVTALAARPFTESGAAAAGDPLAPGHGLLSYLRNL